jgi:hypothetical protein
MYPPARKDALDTKRFKRVARALERNGQGNRLHQEGVFAGHSSTKGMSMNGHYLWQYSKSPEALHRKLSTCGKRTTSQLLRQQCIMNSLVRFKCKMISGDIFVHEMMGHPQRTERESRAFYQETLPTSVEFAQFWGKLW